MFLFFFLKFEGTWLWKNTLLPPIKESSVCEFWYSLKCVFFFSFFVPFSVQSLLKKHCKSKQAGFKHLQNKLIGKWRSSIQRIEQVFKGRESAHLDPTHKKRIHMLTSPPLSQVHSVTESQNGGYKCLSSLSPFLASCVYSLTPPGISHSQISVIEPNR